MTDEETVRLLKFQAKQLHKQTELTETIQKDVRSMASIFRVCVALMLVGLVLALAPRVHQLLSAYGVL